VFRASTIGSLMRDLGLVGELFRADLVGQDEWWITDLAQELGVIPQKIHYWVKQGWVHSRRTPSGKHLIVWADKDELHRLRQLATGKNSWVGTRHPELVIPKGRPSR
jgi:transposase-like protein